MSEISEAVTQLIQPGQVVKIFYNDNNPNNQTRHVRAIVDDEWIVSRVWFESKGDWRYRIDHISEYQIAWEGGGLASERDTRSLAVS